MRASNGQQEEGICQAGAEPVNDHGYRPFCSTACETLSADNRLSRGQRVRQCPPACPRLPPKNLLLPFQGDFGGQVVISALSETTSAVCLQNKTLLFDNEPSSKSACPQIRAARENDMPAELLGDAAAQLPSPAAKCSCMSSCCHPGDGDRDGFPSAPPGKSRCSAPPSPLCRRQRGSSQGCAAPRRAACLWALPQPSWLPRGGTLLTCPPFLLVFYKPWLLHVIRTSTSCPLPCAERDSSTMGHDLKRGLWAQLPPSHSANTSAGESRSSPLKQDSPRVQPPPEQPAKRGWWGEGKR